ncbi:MAG: hypothetical protein EBQ95_06410 [Gammaproteobacteria bacterium]|nr:hypothetical protein [Gammaproteobacteria bacterium]
MTQQESGCLKFFLRAKPIAFLHKTFYVAAWDFLIKKPVGLTRLACEVNDMNRQQQELLLACLL